MFSRHVKFVVKVIAGIYALLFIGRLFNYFPFFFISDIIMREISYCSTMICVVVLICSCYIIDKMKGN